MVTICSKIIVAVICAFIRLNVQSRWLITTIGNTYTHWFQGVFLCFGAGAVKGCSHEQAALGLCSGISPLPGLIRQEIVAISSHSGKGSHGLGQAEQWGLRPSSALWGKAPRKEGLGCPSSSLPSQQSRPKGDHVELDRFERMCTSPSGTFPTSPHARVSDPLSFQVLKPIYTHKDCRKLGSASHGKILWGKCIHHYSFLDIIPVSHTGYVTHLYGSHCPSFPSPVWIHRNILLSVKESKALQSFLWALKCYDSVIRGERKRFFCHFLFLGEERADGEQAGAETARRTCRGSCSEVSRVWGLTLGVCRGMLFYAHLNETASGVSVHWSFRRSVSQLFSNFDSSPKVYFKLPEFLLLSFSKCFSASLLSTKVITTTIIIIKDVLSIEFLKDFCVLWVYESVSSRTPLSCNLSPFLSLSLMVSPLSHPSSF